MWVRELTIPHPPALRPCSGAPLQPLPGASLRRPVWRHAPSRDCCWLPSALPRTAVPVLQCSVPWPRSAPSGAGSSPVPQSLPDVRLVSLLHCLDHSAAHVPEVSRIQGPENGHDKYVTGVPPLPLATPVPDTANRSQHSFSRSQNSDSPATRVIKSDKPLSPFCWGRN